MGINRTVGAAVLGVGLVAGGPVVACIVAPAAAAAVGGTLAPAATATSMTASRPAMARALPSWPVLKQGKNSDWPKVTVRSLQYLLAAHGAKLPVDGLFGPATKGAVVSFQRAHHLTPDGVVGAKTWGVLIVRVKAGSRGPAVRAVQDQANFRNGRNGHSLDVDGVFGPKTAAWVRAFQRAEGLPQDGIVGSLTWQALITESLSG